MRKKPPVSPLEARKAAAKRAALNALKRARRTADKAGVKLSDWEGEFLTDVSERVKTYGPLGAADREAQGDRRQGEGREEGAAAPPVPPQIPRGRLRDACWANAAT